MIRILSLALTLAFAVACSAADSKSLPRSSPEEQGVSSSALASFVEAADQQIESFHSFMLVRHGHVVAEGWWKPYSPESPHSLFSLSKSFTSTAVGLAAAEGKLSIDDKVLEFFPDDAPEKPSDNLKAMRIRDLLRMSAGQQAEAQLSPMADKPWTKIFLAQPVPFKPGTHFMYNTPATYMLSAIVQKSTGSTVLDYLKPRLFEPLGIENPTWGTSPQGVSLGGYGLSIRTEDIAKFGQLYLQKGKWNGKQLVPLAWVEEATARQTSNGSNPKSDWEQGYGYQFWCATHGAYRGDGAFGQYCLVIPEQDAVVAITSGVKDMQAVLTLVWEKLLPAFYPSSLKADESAHKKLEAALAGLSLPMVKAVAPSELAQKIIGKKYEFPSNNQKFESVAFENGDGGQTVLLMRTDGKDKHIVCGKGSWVKGESALGPMTGQPIAVSGGWTSDDTFTARICFYETPFVSTSKFKFEGDKVTFDTESHVGFGPTKQPQLVGTAK